RRTPCRTGSCPTAASAASSARPARRSSALRLSSATRSSVNTGQCATTSRSWVKAAAQRRPSGHGAASATGRRSALAMTAARSRTAARDMTGSVSHALRTSRFSPDGTRPCRSRATERCSAVADPRTYLTGNPSSLNDMLLREALALLRSARYSDAHTLCLLCSFEPLHFKTYLQASLVERFPETAPRVTSWGYDQLELGLQE